MEKRRAAYVEATTQARKAAQEALVSEQDLRLVALHGVPGQRTISLFHLFKTLHQCRAGHVLDAWLGKKGAMVEFTTAEAAHKLSLLVTEGKVVILGHVVTASSRYPGQRTPPAGNEDAARVLNIDPSTRESIAGWMYPNRQVHTDWPQPIAYGQTPDGVKQYHFASVEEAKQAKDQLEDSHPQLKVTHATKTDFALTKERPPARNFYHVVRQAVVERPRFAGVSAGACMGAALCWFLGDLI